MPARLRGLAANVCGERVRVALMEARPAGLTTKQLIVATALSLYQVRKGLLHIREVAAMEHLTPLTWSRKEGYRFSADPTDWIVYETAQFHTELTRITRLITATIAPHAAVQPDDEAVQMMLAQLNGIKGAPPGSAPKRIERKWRNRRLDAEALWCHIHHKGDVFVTTDDNFFKETKKPQLAALGAPLILTPTQAEVHVEQHAPEASGDLDLST